MGIFSLFKVLVLTNRAIVMEWRQRRYIAAQWRDWSETFYPRRLRRR